MSFKGRPIRVATLIKEEIAKLLTKGLKDPRVGFVSVMDVRMSNDLRYANVYVSLYGSESERNSSLIGLRNSAGWIRHEVGKHLHTRTIPEIRFFPDDTLDKVYHLQEVLEEIHAEQRSQPMLKISIEEALDVLRQEKRFLLVSHVNPDGDALGSMLALKMLLQALGKTAITCAIDDELPKLYASLPGAATIRNAEEPPPEYDLAVLVDCGKLSRVGGMADHITPEKRLLVLDHHREEGAEGAIGVIDSRCAATGELIAALYDAAEIAFTPESATCLYVAVATDTGCFRFSNTTGGAHRLAARLIEAGVDVGPLNVRLFSEMSRTKFELVRRALERVEMHADGRVAASWIARQDLSETGALPEDIENITLYYQNIEDVEVAVLFKALDPDATRVSFRSKPGFDSAAFLREFGGGGHPPAAGATLHMPLQAAHAQILEALEKALDRHDADAAGMPAAGDATAS